MTTPTHPTHPKTRWPLIILVIVATFFATAIMFDKLINAPRVYQYAIISPTDFEFIDEINEWGKNGWEVIYMRRATSQTTTGGREARYEITMKKTIIRGPFEP